MTATLIPTLQVQPGQTVAASVHEVIKTYGTGETAVRALDGATL